MLNRAQILPVVIGASVVGLLAFGVGTLGAHGEPANVSVVPDYPSEGPEYDAAMERCALSRLMNAGDPAPSPEGPYYHEAEVLCSYGRTFDNIDGGPGIGPADPDYWTP
ncbi:hypothetical protein [Actinacidiphila sp. bgisy160]|uniref:hypothetical protein n=1 Tax=Actinacidiphila sp. bgisy160 TaxID=3413796 RepID=UPI003D730600